MKYKISDFNLLIDHSEFEYLIFNTYSTSFLKMNKDNYNEIKNNIDNNDFLSDNIEVIKHLHKLGIVILSSFDEKGDIKTKNELWRSNSKSYSVTLVPNIDCNFRCKYCFEDIRPQYMTEQVVSNIEIYFQKRIQLNEIDSLGISWYGGEPLLSKKIIERLSKTFILVKNYKAVIYTNGYSFTDNFIRNLLTYGIKIVHITIDGPRGIHDSYRIHKNGKKTFDTILNNISKIILYNNDEISINIRTNLDDGNAIYYGDLIKEFKKIKSNKISFQFHKIQETDSGIGNKYCEELTEKKYESVSRIAKKELLKYKYRKPLDFLPKNTGFHHCSVGLVNGFAINHDGLVYKCFKDVNPPNNCIGKIDASGDIDYIEAEYIRWNNYNYSESESCKNCIILPVCMGGCTHHRLGLTPSVPTTCDKDGAVNSIRNKIKDVYKLKNLIK